MSTKRPIQNSDRRQLVNLLTYKDWRYEVTGQFGSQRRTMPLPSLQYCLEMDAELEKIPAQIGTAVLDASDGRIVKVRAETASFHLQHVHILTRYVDAVALTLRAQGSCITTMDSV